MIGHTTQSQRSVRSNFFVFYFFKRVSYMSKKYTDRSKQIVCYNINMKNEIWKPIKTITTKDGRVRNFEGYEVSNFGRVRSYRQRFGQVSRANLHAGLGRPLLKNPTIINGRPDEKGYPQFCLSDTNKKRHNIRAHTLVMQTFIGLPKEYQVVCHFDDIKTNNKLENLRYDTQKANGADRRRNKKK